MGENALTCALDREKLRVLLSGEEGGGFRTYNTLVTRAREVLLYLVRAKMSDNIILWATSYAWIFSSKSRVPHGGVVVGF